jgi:predicted SprT family Zn-dependent metalloprotease
MTESNGFCELVKPKKGTPFFRICLCKTLEPEAMFYVLIHEWAHAISWGSETHRIEAHGPEWGIAMSRIWQQLLED